MLKWIINHQSKKISRSPSWGKNRLLTVLSILLALVAVLYLMVVGFLMDRIIMIMFPEEPVIETYAGLVLFYFTSELIMRFYLQEIPALEIQPYRVLPVKRSHLIHYLLLRSAMTLFNLVPLFLVIPFALMQVLPAYGWGLTASWVLSITSLSLICSFGIVYLKKTIFKNSWVMLIFVGLVLLVFALDYYHIIDFRSVSAGLFMLSLHYYFVPAIALLTIVAVYSLCFFTLKRAFYAEQIQEKKHDNMWFNFNPHFKNELITLELRLILRNKRPRSMLLMSLFFILYGFLFYTKDSYMDGYAMLIFVGIFITGGFMINYGQFSFSWESGYFDTFLTKNISYRQIIENKLKLFDYGCLIGFLLSLPYGFFGAKIVLIHIATLLFNMGVNSFFILYFTGKSPKRIDLSKSSMFNYEGAGLAQFILAVPCFMTPLCGYMFFYLFGIPIWGVVLIAFQGVLGIMFRQKLIDVLVKRFNNYKYVIADSLRNND
ncbi:DUF5687 family protein [Fulvivirga sediminis]|uniref:Uncharacterized protein n=1 Tax=Fulvivirga sediminis TaxID=2803949 RepID=A0A937JZT4_9BACT|nr:DUF5687 family protein [Fulvivirga sediminis]MBL3654762.1 hypothetical protein [Fulvivirga sediminis]